MTEKELPRLAIIYNTICEIETLAERMTRINSKKYINLCKEAEKIMDNEYDGHTSEGLHKEILTMEDRLVRDGNLSATWCNLGPRILIHICCRDFNLFGGKEGWTSITHNEEHLGTHWVVGNSTFCDLDNVKYDQQPSWSNYEPCEKCREKLFRKYVKETLKDHPRIPKMLGGTSNCYGLDLERSKGFFILREDEYKVWKKRNGELADKTITRIVMKLPDPGYGLMSAKEWKEKF